MNIIQDFFHIDPKVLVIAIAIKIVLFAVLWKYRKALMRDLSDFFWSMIDEFLDPLMDFTVVLSVIPWEPGDLYAAVKTYKRERHIMGKKIAMIAAFEALAFFIEPVLEIIPFMAWIANPIGWFFNVFPMVTLLSFFFDKTDKAVAEQRLLATEIEIAKNTGVQVKQEEQALKALHELTKKDWPYDADQFYRKEHPEKRIAKLLCTYVDQHLSITLAELQEFRRKAPGVPKELEATMNAGIMETITLIRKAKDAEGSFMSPIMTFLGRPPKPEAIKESIALAEEANKRLNQAIATFNQQYKLWRLQKLKQVVDAKAQAQAFNTQEMLKGL